MHRRLPPPAGKVFGNCLMHATDDPPIITPPTKTSTRWGIFAAVVIALAVIYVLRFILLPFVAAAALTYIAGPAICWGQQRLRVPRWVAALACYFVYLTIFSLMGLGLRYFVAPQAIEMTSHLPETMHQFLVGVFHGEELHLFGETISARDLSYQALDQLGQWAKDPSKAIIAVTLGFSTIMAFVLMLVLLIYFMLDGPRLTRGVLWLVPPPLRPRARHLALEVEPVIGRYIAGAIVVVAYTIIVTWVVTQFIMHLSHAFLLAIAVGLLELIPVVGPILSFALIGLIAIQQVHFWMIISFAIFAIALRLSIDQFVGPIVFGKAMRLPPPVIIFAFLVGGALFGILGVVLAIPVAAAIKVVLAEIYGENVEEA